MFHRHPKCPLLPALFLALIFVVPCAASGAEAPEVLWWQGMDVDVQHAAISHDGRKIATAQSDGRDIGIRDLPSGKLLFRIPFTITFQFSRDDRILYSFHPFSTGPSEIHSWRVSDGASLGSRSIDLTEFPSGVLYNFLYNFLPDGETFVAGWLNETFDFKMWRSSDGQLLRSGRLPVNFNQYGGIGPLRFSPDGQFLAIHAGRRTLEVWNLAEERLQWAVDENLMLPRFSPDSRLLLAEGDEGVQVFRTADGMRLPPIPLPVNERMIDSRVSSDGGTVSLILQYKDRGDGLWADLVRTYRMSDRALTYTTPLNGRALFNSRYHLLVPPGSLWADDETLLLRSNDRIELVDRRDGARKRFYTLPSYAGRFSPDSKRVALLSDSRFYILDGDNGSPLHAFESESALARVNAAAFSPDGGILASGHGSNTHVFTVMSGGDFTVRLWDPKDGRILRELPHQGPVRSLAFSSDGQKLVTGSGSYSQTSCWMVPKSSHVECSTTHHTDNRFQLWRVSDGQFLTQSDSFPSEVLAVALSPDGERIVTGGGDGVLTLWTVGGQTVRTLPCPVTPVRSIAFTPDGQEVRAAYGDNVVRFWRVSDGRLLRTLEGFHLSTDGNRIARTHGSDLQLLRASDGQVIASYDREVQGIVDLAFSPDGERFSYLRKDGQHAVARIPPPLPFLRGDADSDSKVDVADVIRVLQYIVSGNGIPPFHREAAEMDGNGVINVMDAVMILRLIVGLGPDTLTPAPAPDEFRQGLSAFWRQKQVAGVAAFTAPSLNAVGGVLRLTSANNDIWKDIWEPYFVYQEPIAGDFSMRVRIESLPECSDLSAAGLMLAQFVPDRITADGDIPPWGLVLATKGYGAEAKWGSHGESETSLSPGVKDDSLKPPYWLRLDRRGHMLSYFTSTDGRKTWNTVAGPVDMAAKGWALNGSVAAGIVQQTHCGATPGTAVLSNFQAGPISMAGRLPGDQGP